MTGHEQHDAAVRALMRAAAPEPPVDDVDWNALHARIASSARPLLQRTPHPAWWQLLAGWSARGVPIAAAAAASIALLIGTGVIGERSVPPAVTVNAHASFVTVEEELTYATTEEERAVLIAGIDADEMLDAVLFYQEEP